MFVNLKKMREDGVEVKASITEFYPLVEDLTIVPASKVPKRAFFAFGDCVPDTMSIGPLPEEHILDFEKYSKTLKKFMKEVNEISDEEIDLFLDVEQMYQRYSVGVKNFAISGVVSIINTTEDKQVESYDDSLLFVPITGTDYCLDIESYWKSLMYIIPNVIADTSTVVKMFDNYRKHEQFNGNGEKQYPTKLLLESENIKGFVESVKAGIEKLDIDTKELKNIALNEDIERAPELTPYYEYMLRKHKVGQSEAASYIWLAFPTHYKKMYDELDISDLYNTDISLVVKLKNRKVGVGDTSSLF